MVADNGGTLQKQQMKDIGNVYTWLPAPMFSTKGKETVAGRRQ